MLSLRTTMQVDGRKMEIILVNTEATTLGGAIYLYRSVATFVPRSEVTRYKKGRCLHAFYMVHTSPR
jgi:hypothetical protein